MNVEQVLWPRVVSITPEDRLIDAAWKMREFEIGSVLVMHDKDVEGIVTERDLLRAYVDGASLALTPVVDYMTQRPRMIEAGTEVTEAAALMLRIAARHLPVTKAGRVIGMVSSRDLLAVLSGRPQLFRVVGD
jgi:CBS domain-containing protein